MSLTMNLGVRGGSRRILFVSHEATRTGAPMFLLHFLRWLRANTRLDFELLLLKGGALKDDFAKIAKVWDPRDFVEGQARITSFDLVYANTVCNGLVLETIGCANVPVITHVHELDMGYNWLGARAMTAMVRQSSRYIACAEAVAGRLRTVFGIPPEMISVHYEMIDADVVSGGSSIASEADIRNQYNLPPEALIVTGCGTFDLRKAPDVFVQVAARIKKTLGSERPLRFLWIGSQNAADLLSAARHDVRKLGMEAEIEFISELPSPHGLIALSDVFCLTSREDPFPLIMLESALLGKSVLCFEGAGGAAEFCREGGGVAVPYLDAFSMAEVACSLLQDTARRQEQGAKAAAVVRSRFTVEAVAPALWAELQQHLAVGLSVPSERAAEVSNASIFRKWNLSQAPERAYVEASLAREASRKEAKRLADKGRRKEAVQVLVNAVAADVATKRHNLICDGLVELAYDMMNLDPRQAAAMIEQARQLASRVGLRLDSPPPTRQKVCAHAA